MQKKPYTPPTVTDMGDAIEKTKGMSGDCWEYFGNSPGTPPRAEEDE